MKKRFSSRILADSCSKISRLQTCNPCLPIVNNFVNKAQSFILHYYLRPKEGQVWTKKPCWLTFLAIITVEIVNSLSWITREISCNRYNGLLWKENKKRGVKKSISTAVSLTENQFSQKQGLGEGCFRWAIHWIGKDGNYFGKMTPRTYKLWISFPQKDKRSHITYNQY